MDIRFLAGAASIALGAAQAVTAQPVQPAQPVPPPTGAPAPVQADARPIDDIIVTAQFRGQRLQDTPIAITATTAATLEAKSITSITDLTATAPNVNLTAASGLNGSAVNAYIRGIGQNDSSFALEPGVGIYIDDIYYGTTFGAVLDLTDLDRVEVLRGPQGTLSGKNSIGGAVKLFTRKPDADGGGFVEATTGRYGRIDVRASAGFTVADGLYARLSGVSKHTDGFMKLLDFGCVNPNGGLPSERTGNGCKTGSEGGIDIKGIRGALRYAPDGSRLEVNLIGDYARNDSQQVASKLLFANNPNIRSYVPGNPFAGVPFDGRFLTGPKSYTSYATYASGGNYTTPFCAPGVGCVPNQVAPGGFRTSPDSTANSFGVSGNIDYRLAEGLSLKSITAYRTASGTSGIDLDGSPLSVLLQQFAYQHKQFTQELRLSGKVGTLADITVGGFLYDANDRLSGRVQIPNVQFDFLQNDPVSNNSKSVFAYVELHPATNLNLIGGLRYTKDRKTYLFRRRNPDGTLPSGIPFTPNWLVAGLDGQVGTFDGDRVDYRLAANYRFNDQLMAYAQVSTGYKGGGVNPRPYVPDQIVAFAPETLTAYEAGFKSDLFDRRLRVNAAAFFNDYRDIQINRYVCVESASVTCSQPANGGDAHVWGLEGEVTAEPFEGLTVDGGFGYLNFKYTRVDPTTLVTLDDKAPFNPKWQANAGIQYRAELGNAGTITPRFDWNYQSTFFFNPTNNDGNRVPGRGLFNLRISFDSADTNWRLSSGVTNLFDKYYYVGKSENIANYGVNTGILGRPREWFVSLRRNFR